MVASVVPAAGQVHPLCRAVVQPGGAAPSDTVIRRQGAGALGIVEVDRLLQHFSIVKGGGAGRVRWLRCTSIGWLGRWLVG